MDTESKARRDAARAKAKPLGEGSRFAEIKAKAKAGGARNPGAVAAAAGIKAHGKAAMARYSAKGRRDADEERTEVRPDKESDE